MYDDDHDALAAEYVLGTLSADERDHAEALIAIDPGFAELVRVWERRLGELNVMVEAVEPPADVWDKIRTGVETDPHGAEMSELLPAIEEAVMRVASEAAAAPDAGDAAEPPRLVSEPVPSVPEDAEDSAAVTALASSLAPEAEPQSTPHDLDDAAAVAALASTLAAEPPSGADAVPPAATEPPAEPPMEATAAAEATPPAEPAAPPPSAEHATAADGANVVYLSRRAKRWQGLTGLMTAVAALLALYIGVDRFAPNLLPHGRQAAPPVVAAQPPANRLVAVLQQDPTAPAFLVTVDPQSRTMTVRRVTAAADTGRSYELWLIAGKDAAPQSLGLVGEQEFTTKPLPATLDPAAMRAASYAVSLEPAGGAPHGTPTGPILFTGKMVEAVPGSAAGSRS